MLMVIGARAAVEVTASRTLTIQPGGPRSGENGTKYFNIEGKDNQASRCQAWFFVFVWGLRGVKLGFLFSFDLITVTRRYA
jgi:hypothetical protein